MSKNLWSRVLAASLSSWVAPSLVLAHTRLDYPPARDMRDDHKDSNGGAPCGIARTSAQPLTMLAPGAPVDVKWTETVDHPGCFLIDFSSAGDANFQMLANVKHVATGGTPRAYTKAVTVPTNPCTACTLRVRQVMLANETTVCPPATIPTDVTYYACGNVVFAGAQTGAGGGSAGGAGGRSGSGGTQGAGGRGGGNDMASASGGSDASGGATGTGGTPMGPAGTGGLVTSSGGGSASGGAPGAGGVFAASGGSIGSGAAAGAGTPGIVAAEPGACACATIGGPTPLPTAVALVGIWAMLAFRRPRNRGGCRRVNPRNQTSSQNP